jgi:hypothetical protein
MMKRAFVLALLLSTALAPAAMAQCGPGGDASCFSQPVVVGTATGGAKGAGTVNAAGGYYVNGVAIAGAVPGQLAGTATNDAATAGNVGELIEAVIAGPVAMTTATDTTIGSVALTGGDWQCGGTMRFAPAGTTTVSQISTQLSLGTTIGVAGTGATQIQATLTTGAVQLLPLSGIRVVAPAGSTTLRLIANATFGVSTLTGSGYIGCRRAR